MSVGFIITRPSGKGPVENVWKGEDLLIHTSQSDFSSTSKGGNTAPS